MTAGIILVIALMLLVTQLMVQGSTEVWPSITLASEFSVPPDRIISDWIILDKPIRFILYDIQLWIVLLFSAALIYWVTDWASEMLSRMGKSVPPPELSQEKSALTGEL